VPRRPRLFAGRRGPAHVALVCLGLAVALWIALPLADVDHRCPPRGEGYALCALQKAWLPAVVLALAGLAAGHLAARMLLVHLPAWRVRARTAGERRSGAPDERPEPPYSRDPFLLASTWGVKRGRTERRGLLARLRRR